MVTCFFLRFFLVDGGGIEDSITALIEPSSARQ